MHTPIRMHLISRRTLRLVAALLGLTGLCAYFLTAKLVVGLDLIPNKSGTVACGWDDRSGATHRLKPLSTKTGHISFSVPLQATMFRFHFAPSNEPYQIKALSLYHLPFLNAQWLNNMLNPEEPIYTQQYMGSHDTIRIGASTERSLSYVRFFSLLLRFTRGVHLVLTALPFGLLCLVFLSRKPRDGTCVMPGHLNNFSQHVKIKPPAKAFLVLFLSVVILLLCLPPPVVPTTPGCDASWSWLLNHFALNLAGIGTSIFFTYGPLGFTVFPQPIGDNVTFSLVFNLMYILLFNATIYTILTQLRCSPARIYPLLLCLILLPSNNEWRWAFLIVLLLTACFYLPNNHRRTLILLSGCTGVLIAYATLIKFSLAISVGLNVLMILVLMMVYRREVLLTFLLPLVVTLLSGIVLARYFLFPSFASMLTWVQLSWEIASGYNTAMVTQVTWLELVLPSVLAFSFLVLLFPLRSFSSRRFVLLTLVAPTVFFAFKYSITRAGIGTMRATAYVVPCMTAILMLFTDSEWRPRVMRLFAVQLAVGVCLSVITGVSLQSPIIGLNYHNFVDSLNLKRSLARVRDHSDQALLDVRLPPHWIQWIGTNTFCSYPSELTYAPANKLKFTPFPIVQGYSDYTRTLDLIGASLFSGEQAPSWLLCAFSKPDQRNGLVDTPAVWNAIRSHYQFVDISRHGVLLKHQPPMNTSPLKLSRRCILTPGEWLDLSSMDMNTTYMSVEWPPSVLGKLLSLGLRNTQCSFTLTRTDGKTHRWRLVPDTAQTPFPIGLIPFTNDEFLQMFKEHGQTPFPISRIKFDCGHPWYYSRHISVSLYSQLSTPHQMPER